MSNFKTTHLTSVVSEYHDQLLDGWLASLVSSLRRDKNSAANLREQASQFLPLLASSLSNTGSINIEEPGWADLRQLLAEISHSRVRQGFSPIETASFVFSLKKPIFELLRNKLADSPQAASDEIAATSSLFDDLGLYVIDVYQKAREQVILRQQQELLELSTPVVQLWQNVLALPLIGTLDSARTQVVM